MRILVAYLATPGGADAVALGARLARSLEADLEITMVLPPETVIDPPGNYEELLTERAQEWLTEAKELVGGYWFIVATSLDEAASLAAENPCLAFGLTLEVRPLHPARAEATDLTNETPVTWRTK